MVAAEGCRGDEAPAPASAAGSRAGRGGRRAWRRRLGHRVTDRCRVIAFVAAAVVGRCREIIGDPLRKPGDDAACCVAHVDVRRVVPRRRTVVDPVSRDGGVRIGVPGDRDLRRMGGGHQEAQQGHEQQNQAGDDDKEERAPTGGYR